MVRNTTMTNEVGIDCKTKAYVRLVIDNDSRTASNDNLTQAHKTTMANRAGSITPNNGIKR